MATGVRVRTVTRHLPATGGGAITRSVLPGGLRILTEAMPGVRSVSVGIWVAHCAMRTCLNFAEQLLHNPASSLRMPERIKGSSSTIKNRMLIDSRLRKSFSHP